MNAHVAVVTISDIATQVRGVSYDKADASSEPADGKVALLRANNIIDDDLAFDDLVYVPESRVSGKQRLRQHDVVIAASSGSLAAVGKAGTLLTSDFDGTFGAFCKVLRPDLGRVDARYFAHFFKTAEYRRKVSSLAAGANINNLKNEHLDNLVVPLPPLDDQRRIAAILDKADALRQKRKRAIALLDSLTQSIFLEMFGDVAAKTTLGAITTEFRYGTSQKSGNTGNPTLRIPNVIGGQVSLDDLKTVEVGKKEFERLKLQVGDILFVRTNGNRDNVGRSAVVDEQLGAALGLPASSFIFASYLIRARLAINALRPAYVQAYLSSARGRASLLERSKTSAGQFNINTEGLASIPLPMPKIELQFAFERRISSIREQLVRLSANAADLNLLFSSLQHRAFSGQL